eukprot:1152021-Pelagomonas_calceolata.AAC.7
MAGFPGGVLNMPGPVPGFPNMTSLPMAHPPSQQATRHARRFVEALAPPAHKDLLVPEHPCMDTSGICKLIPALTCLKKQQAFCIEAAAAAAECERSFATKCLEEAGRIHSR